MKKISFIYFCVEYYAQHITQPSDEVYALFKREQVLNFLENDYDDLHGMGMEYMMQIIDEYLGVAQTEYAFAAQIYEKPCCGGINMNHATTRAVLVPEIVRLISEKYHISETEALDKFYTSATGASFADDETGLYGQSALYIFGLFCEESKQLSDDEGDSDL